MSILKHCPFCGGKPVYMNLGDCGHWVECSNDKCHVKPCIEEGQKSKRKATLYWNERSETPK